MGSINTVNSKGVTQEVKRFEKSKWVVIALIVAVAVWGNVHFGQMLLLYRVLALVGLGIVAAFIALQTHKGALFWNMLKEAKAEVRKVIWPTRQETMQTTLIVVIAVVIMGLILWGIDSLLGWLVQRFIS